MNNQDYKDRLRWPEGWVRGHIACWQPWESVEFEQAVRRWQEQHSIEVDGLLGPMTFAAMRLHHRSPNTADIAWLARIMTAEASIANERECECVGWTVINRMLRNPKRYGHDPEAVATGRAYAKASRSSDFEPDGRSLRLADHLLKERRNDPTKGATHFFSPRSQPDRDLTKTWPGEELAKHNRMYRDGEEYFIWDARDQRRRRYKVYGWVEVRDDRNKKRTRGVPSFAQTMNYVPIEGVRDWWFRFYKH